MSVTAKLVASFAVTLMLVVGAGTAAVWISLDYERTLQSMYNDHVQGAVTLADAMDALWKLR